MYPFVRIDMVLQDLQNQNDVLNSKKISELKTEFQKMLKYSHLIETLSINNKNVCVILLSSILQSLSEIHKKPNPNGCVNIVSWLCYLRIPLCHLGLEYTHTQCWVRVFAHVMPLPRQFMLLKVTIYTKDVFFCRTNNSKNLL